MRLAVPKFRFPLLTMFAVIVASLIGFAAAFDVDQAVRAQGQVIPGSRTQVIQALDGGLVTDLRVREGDRVRAGQVLAMLEPDRAEAGFDMSQAEVASKEIALVRARAELAGQRPSFGTMQAAWPDFVAAQTGIFNQKKRGLREEVALLEASLGLATEELHMNQRLLMSGDIAQTEVMRSQRQVFEIQSKISAARNKYLQDTRVEVARLEDELSASGYRLEEKQNILRHTELTSPMDGVVKFVRVSTVGGVLRPGDELMQISPVDDELLLELKVNPADVGQLRVGLPVAVRFDAFDSSIYGILEGKLKYVSPDTLREEGADGKASIYYRALVHLNLVDAKQGSRRISARDIRPGMTVTADIRTGRRSILSFLMKPIERAFTGAFLVE